MIKDEMGYCPVCGLVHCLKVTDACSNRECRDIMAKCQRDHNNAPMLVKLEKSPTEQLNEII